MSPPRRHLHQAGPVAGARKAHIQRAAPVPEAGTVGHHLGVNGAPSTRPVLEVHRPWVHLSGAGTIRILEYVRPLSPLHQLRPVLVESRRAVLARNLRSAATRSISEAAIRQRGLPARWRIRRQRRKRRRWLEPGRGGRGRWRQNGHVRRQNRYGVTMTMATRRANRCMLFDRPPAIRPPLITIVLFARYRLPSAGRIAQDIRRLGRPQPEGRDTRSGQRRRPGRRTYVGLVVPLHPDLRSRGSGPARDQAG